MIITKLKGGLGNQLFQYAAGFALAEKYNTILKIDISQLTNLKKTNYTLRNLELTPFNLDVLIADDTEIKPFLLKAHNKINRLLQRKIPFIFNPIYIAESGKNYFKNFKYIPENAYLDGFWQSESYFSDIKVKIKTIFQFNNSILQLAKKDVELIHNTESVSIHIRRGDYLSLEHVYHTCTLDYYLNSITYIKKKIDIKLDFFIFSDDIDWCKENIKINFDTHYIETKNAHVDLYLMTQCKHNIIANSSFSWWGAWLNNNATKIVVAPKNWYKNENTPDIYPTNWVKI